MLDELALDQIQCAHNLVLRGHYRARKLTFRDQGFALDTL